MDDAAVADAFKTYGGAVYRRCLRILRDPEGARDVTQEVFVRCFDRRGGLRDGRELLGWLYRVATNLCLNALRDRKLRREADQQLAPALSARVRGRSRRLRQRSRSTARARLQDRRHGAAADSDEQHRRQHGALARRALHRGRPRQLFSRRRVGVQDRGRRPDLVAHLHPGHLLKRNRG